MNILSKLIGGIATLIKYKQKDFIFERSKKHIASWGEYTYGKPTILNYDNKSKVTVGRYCSIASNVTFLVGANHKKGSIPNYPLSRIDVSVKAEDTNDRGDIVLGHDVWIGYGAILIGPVTVGNGAIIGAGSVVTRDIPAFGVAVGTPAQVVKYRFDENKIKEIETLAWWNWSIEKVKNNISSLY